MPRARLGARLSLAALLGLAGCGGGEGGGGGEEEITVFAAASLTEAFTEIGADFETANPGTDVRFSFSGSSTLARQISQGAPADVFASADRVQMREVAESGQVAGEPTVFVQNHLQIVVPRGNPAQVSGLAAFGRDELTIALCAAQVPCGAASRDAFELAGVTPAPDTLEQDVKAVLTKTALGEVDAGLVYVTDVATAGSDVEGVDFAEAEEAVNDYPIAVLDGAAGSETARAFVDHVLSPQGKAVLEDLGFGTEIS